MDYFGVYHSDYSRTGGGVCDAPCITKGRMTLCARRTASEGGLIAMVEGRVRDLPRLAASVGAPAGADAAKVVLRAYRQWGADFPRHIEGPVAACVMDSDADAMVLSRDRMGEKAVFYADRGDSVSFSDHPDALLKADRAAPVIDADGLRELFGFGPARTPGRTCLKEIMMLEPGCALVVRGGVASVERYFAIEARPHEEDAPHTVSHVRGLLEQCVDDVAALNPAVMLSGGLDSTALAALLSKRNAPILSFSVDYRDNARDFRPNAFRPERDAPFVELAVRALHTQHRTVTLEQASLAHALGRAVSLRGFPGMADIDASLLLLAEEIRRFGGWVVSGECGDEVFCGYPWFAGDAPLNGFPWSGSLALRESLLKADVREALRIGEYVRDTFEARRALADPGPGFAPEERRHKALQKLCFEYFMPNLQERATRMCEGAGVRVLTPLCDERLVQYVYNVPRDMIFMGGQEKGLFREAVHDLLPEPLLRRKKSPYPKTCSPAYARIVRAMAMRLLSEGEAPIFEFVDRDRMRQIAESDLDPADTPWFGQLMAGAQLLGYLWQVNRWLAERRITAQL